MDKKKLVKGILSIGAPLMLLIGFGKKLVSGPDKKVKAVHPGRRVKKMTIDSDQVAIPEVHIDTDDEEPEEEKSVDDSDETRDVGIVDDDEVALPIPKVEDRKKKHAGSVKKGLSKA
jgi:hypothetical protein